MLNHRIKAIETLCWSPRDRNQKQQDDAKTRPNWAPIRMFLNTLIPHRIH
jgi:hypothetical protein